MAIKDRATTGFSGVAVLERGNCGESLEEVKVVGRGQSEDNEEEEWCALVERV